MSAPSAGPTAGRRRLAWVVDVQHDFMEPAGRLYVHDLFDSADPGASVARAAIIRTVAWMRRVCDAVVFTGDWHAYGDREIVIDHPDAGQGTYPPHCMGAAPDAEERRGAALIPEIDPGERAIVLERDASNDRAAVVARAAVQSNSPVFIQKKEFSVFEGNAATDAFLGELTLALGDRPEVIVCGVATDVCVRHAVEGFLTRGFDVRIVADATHGLGLIPTDDLYQGWAARGARILALPELESSA
ncbi:MAG: isochorismatase family cysteine hydrolase [Gemmatimonadaceae bacterium]